MATTTKTLIAAMVIAIASATAAASAQPFMPTGNLSTQPVGHYEFCKREAQECQRIREAAPVKLSRELWATIIEVNNLVNTMITPRTDYEMWGIEEHWSYPVHGLGDCEDYVLEKRRRLIAAGIPGSNLPITVVRQQNGDGHAVLTVRTNMGDFILDNLEARVLAWQETDYRYLKRQSPKHAGMWVAIDDGRNVLVGSVSGRR